MWSFLANLLKILIEFFWTHPSETTTKTVSNDDRLDDATRQLDRMRSEERDHPHE